MTGLSIWGLHNNPESIYAANFNKITGGEIMKFKDVISTRRAVNFFDSQKPVSHELLKELVETAALSPSGFNLQPWSLSSQESER